MVRRTLPIFYLTKYKSLINRPKLRNGFNLTARTSAYTYIFFRIYPSDHVAQTIYNFGYLNHNTHVNYTLAFARLSI